MTIFSVIFGIILFSLLIFIHELGHFTAAKLFHVQVNEFSMFMGPALWKKQKGETLYAIRLIPLGGYCEMEGEDGEGRENPRSFCAAAWWKRLVILVAGPMMNLLAGLVLFAIFFAPQKAYNVPVVAAIEQGSALAATEDAPGLMEGDRILKLDSERIYMYSDFNLVLTANANPHTNPEDRHDLVVLRDGQKVELKNFAMEKREFVNEDGSTSLRYGFSFGAVDRSLKTLISQTWNACLSNVRMVRISLQMLFNGKASVKDLSGPVGIVAMMSETANQSGSFYYALLNMLSFGGLITVNLGVMNLLPIPGLDGARAVGVLLTTLIECITRKKVNPRYEGYIQSAGTLVLFALLIVIMFKDVIQIFRG